MPAADPADQQAARAFEAELRAAVQRWERSPAELAWFSALPKRIRRSGRLLEAAQLEAQVLLDHARDSWAKERKREATREARLTELRTQPRDLDCLRLPDSSGGAWQGIGRRKKRCRAFNAVGRAFNARKQVQSFQPKGAFTSPAGAPIDIMMADAYLTTPPGLREAVEQLVVSVRKVPPYSRWRHWEIFSPNPDYRATPRPATPLPVPTPKYPHSPEPGVFHCLGLDVNPQVAWLVARGRHQWSPTHAYTMRDAVFEVADAEINFPGVLDTLRFSGYDHLVALILGYSYSRISLALSTTVALATNPNIMPRPQPSGLSGIVATIPPPSGGTDNTPVEVTNFKALGSYNWIEDNTPTIAVPGIPPRWKDRPMPIHLSKDLEAPFFDEGIARKSGYTLEPLLLAIEVSQETDPDFDLSKEGIDIVSNRKCLRKLMRFSNSGVKAQRKSHFGFGFRVDAQLALNGRTMILSGYDNQVNPQQDIPTIPSDHICERLCTEELPTIHATDSSGDKVNLRPVGYYRIIRYDLLGLRFLVRSRVDGMVGSSPHPQLEVSSEPEIERLSIALEKTLELKSDDVPIPLHQNEGLGLRHVKFGEYVPQDMLMDIKLVPKGKINWNAAYPQHLLSQTPNLKVANRTITPRGENFVTQIQTYDQHSLKAEHEKQSPQFRRLVSVLKQMRQIIQTHGSSSQPLAFVWSKKGNLWVYKIREKGKYLSDKGLDKF
ncbi:hypothetical protein FRC11_009827 [Ceratobasidium sp. 423]|nr:hypothetical protein FRC11_009827 [Ceratobasidium sp. 423]